MDPQPKVQESPSERQPELIKDNQQVIIYESEKVMKLHQTRAGTKFQTSSGAAFRYATAIGQPLGSTVEAFNRPGENVVVLEPRAVLITETLSRKTQILYTMDNSAILFRLDVKPGDVVVEAGTGSGSLSCAISESIGDTGKLYTFEFNQERAEITKEFFEKLQKKNITSTWRDIVNNGFKIEGDAYQADSLFLDIPNPWAALQHVKEVVKKNGKICCFSPCIEQVQRTCEQMRKDGYKKIQIHECLIRPYDLNNRVIQLDGIQQQKRLNCYSKAVHSNRGHTGFLTFAII